MAKYSTGGGGGSSGGSSCELCGTSSGTLREATIAGAKLLVCPSCAPHDDAQRSSDRRSDSGGDDADRRRRAARKIAELRDAQRGDPHWAERGTNYDDDPLPYLISGYDEVVLRARQEAGLQIEELADELGVSDDRLLAIEQGRAARAGVGGSVIERLEDRFGIELAE